MEITKKTIEIILSPTRKSQLKAFIYDLFGKFNIDEDNDVKSVEYFSTQKNNLYDLCIIQFANEFGSDEFHRKCLQENGESIILSVRLIDDEDLHSISDDDENISVCSSSISAVKYEKESFVNVEPSSSPFKSLPIQPSTNLNDTTKYISNIMSQSTISTNNSMSRIDTNMSMSAIFPSSSSSSLQNNEIINTNTSSNSSSVTDDENRVEFQIIPRIKEENIDDLELILLFVQNKKRSGGGDYEDYHLNDTKSTLIVKYKEAETKKRILAKHTFTFKNYTLNASEPFNEGMYEKNKNTLILKNIMNTDDNLFLTLYAENIVPDNEILDIYTSKIFHDTYYIKFQNEFDFDMALARQKRRPIFRDRKIDIMETYQTKSIVCVLENRKDIMYDIIDLHFTNKKRSGVDSYVSIKEKKPFLIIQFQNEDQLNAVLTKKHDLCKQELIVENYYNIKLIDDELNHLMNDSISEVSTVTSTISSLTLQNEPIKPNAVEEAKISTPNIKEEPLKYELTEKKNSIVYNLIIHSNEILTNFKEFLKKHNYNLNKTECECYIMINNKKDFNKIDELLEEFIKINNLVYNFIIIPRYFERKDYCKFLQLNDSYSTYKANSFIEFYGTQDSYQTFSFEVVKDLGEARNKFDWLRMELDCNKENRIKVLYFFHGVYYKEFVNRLLKLNVKCELCNNEYKVMLKQVVSAHDFSDINFKKLVEEHLKSFFDKFKWSSIECKGDSKTQIDAFQKECQENKLHIEYCGLANNIEVFGLREYVDKFVESVNRVDNELGGFSLNEGRILFAVKYASDMETKYPPMKVKIDTKKCKITYDSSNVDDIENAKNIALDLFKKICSVNFLCEPIQKEFMVTNERGLIKWLKEKELLCVFDLKETTDSYTIYATSKDEIKTCFEKLTASMMVKKYRLDTVFCAKVDSFLSHLQSTNSWSGNNAPNGYIAKKVEPQTFCICGFREQAEAFDKEFREYIEKN